MKLRPFPCPQSLRKWPGKALCKNWIIHIPPPLVLSASPVRLRKFVLLIMILHPLEIEEWTYYLRPCSKPPMLHPYVSTSRLYETRKFQLTERRHGRWCVSNLYRAFNSPSCASIALNATSIPPLRFNPFFSPFCYLEILAQASCRVFRTPSMRIQVVHFRDLSLKSFISIFTPQLSPEPVALSQCYLKLPNMYLPQLKMIRS